MTAMALAVMAALHAPAAAASTLQEPDPSTRWPVSPAQLKRIGEVAVDVDRNDLPADGQTPARMSIRVLDAAGNPLQGETMITVEVSAGRLKLPTAAVDEAGLAPADAQRSTPQLQVIARDGKAEVWLLAPVEPQAVNVQVSAGEAVARGQVNFVPELREMIAAGLVDGVIHVNRKGALGLSQARPDDGFEEAITQWSRESGDGKRDAALRAAIFLKGKIKGDALLTFAYDSDKPDRDVLFRDIDPERWYPVYGDASITGFEARSNSRLYLRLDKDRHYLMYGDIATGDGFSQRFGQGEVASSRTRDLGQYNRSMTGVRGHLENDRGSLDVFAADDDLRQVVEEFPGRGLSGPYTVTNSASAVLGTDRIELITRDRNVPSRIISVKTLARFTDYTFEPFSGRILFTRPVPSVDAELNPVSVRVTYEVEQGGGTFWVYGANGQYRVTPRFEIGGSYVKDENPLAPFELASANTTFHLGRRTWLRGEYARTRSALDSTGGNIYTLDRESVGPQVDGDAWRAEFGHEGTNFAMLAWYGQSDRNFNNPSSSYLGGRDQAGLDARWSPAGDASWWQLYAQATWVHDRLTTAEQTQARAGLRLDNGGRWSLDIGAHHVSEHAGDAWNNGLVVPGNLTAPYGVGVVSPGIGGGFLGSSPNALDPSNGQTLYNTGSSWSRAYGSWVGNGLAGVPVEYTALQLAGSYRVTDTFSLQAEVEMDTSHSEHRSAALGGSLQVHEKTRLHGRYQWNTGLSTVATTDGVIDPATGVRHPSPYESNAFVFGLETDYMDGGTLFNEYRMYDSFGARQAQWASGVRNLWQVSPQLSLQTGIEKLELLDGSGQESTAATVASEWRPDERWLLSGRIEWRGTEAGESEDASQLPSYESWLSTLTLARKLSRDWTLLARNYYLLNTFDDDRPDSYEDRFQLGFSYRDTDTNRANVLGKYEYWTRRDRSATEWLGSESLAEYSEGYDKHVASVVADWHPSRVWWLTGRVAGKRQTDYFADMQSRYTAYLAGGRITYDLSERWDVSTQLHTMWSPGGSAQHAAGVELGYLVTSNLWLSAGYNFAGFRDDDLTGGEYTDQGIYLRLRFKFDETVFKRNDPSVNPALPR